jgi:regulator of protease activity HflC (stomatin/prohibitin superfamily)
MNLLFDWTTGTLVAVLAVAIYLASCIKIIKEYERGVLFFLVRYTKLLEPGLRFVLAPVFRVLVIDLRIIAEDVPPQDIITRDNVSARVNAVIYFRVVHPDQAVLEVEHYRYATSQLAQTSLRSIVGAHDLDELLSERDKLNAQLQEIMDQQTDPWGIKVTSVEIKHVDLPQDRQRAMARQAEAERDRRAKIIAAEGEFQAAEKLTNAAEVMGQQRLTLQLRYLQTLVQVAADKNSTLIFPLPMELLEGLSKRD